MASTSRHPVSGPSALLRVLAAYLVAILLMQGLAAAFALGAGPLHRHLPATTTITTASLLSHHDHAHATNQRHDHDAGDTTVALDAAAQESADAAAHALTLALSLLALQTPRAAADHSSHVLLSSATWFWHSLPGAPLIRPPIQA